MPSLANDLPRMSWPSSERLGLRSVPRDTGSEGRTASALGVGKQSGRRRG
jgi:hypothetical protein